MFLSARAGFLIGECYFKLPRWRSNILRSMGNSGRVGSNNQGDFDSRGSSRKCRRAESSRVRAPRRTFGYWFQGSFRCQSILILLLHVYITPSILCRRPRHFNRHEQCSSSGSPAAIVRRTQTSLFRTDHASVECGHTCIRTAFLSTTFNF